YVDADRPADRTRERRFEAPRSATDLEDVAVLSDEAQAVEEVDHLGRRAREKAGVAERIKRHARLLAVTDRAVEIGTARRNRLGRPARPPETLAARAKKGPHPRAHLRGARQEPSHLTASPQGLRVAPLQEARADQLQRHLHAVEIRRRDERPRNPERRRNLA